MKKFISNPYPDKKKIRVIVNGLSPFTRACMYKALQKIDEFTKDTLDIVINDQYENP